MKETCFYCGTKISINAGNPFKWPIHFPAFDGTGIVHAHCTGCVVDRISTFERLPTTTDGFRVIPEIDYIWIPVSDRRCPLTPLICSLDYLAGRCYKSFEVGIMENHIEWTEFPNVMLKVNELRDRVRNGEQITPKSIYKEVYNNEDK